MVSQRQLEKEKKYLAKKKKEKKAKKAKKAEVRKVSDNLVIEIRNETDIVDEDIDTYLKENKIDPAFHEVFKKFYAPPPQIDQQHPQEEEPKIEEAQTQPIISKKKLRKLARPTVFELKQMVKRPEVVE